MKEEWRRCYGLLGNRYLVSDQGNVESIRRGPVRVRVKPNGYRYVLLCADGVKFKRYVHRLVLEAFVGPCLEGMECDHINTDPGDNRLENLRWVTRSQNMQNPITREHASRSRIGRPNPRKLVICVETGIAMGSTVATAEHFGVSASLISYACRTGRGIHRLGCLHFKYYSKP